MGLSDILSNPQLIGMAMAGLSRDPEAPMNAMKSLSMVEDINRRREEEFRKEQQRADDLRLMQALSAAQNEGSGFLTDAIKQMSTLRSLPQTGQQFVPDQSSGTATDLETGQSYTPQQTQPRSEALDKFYANYALAKKSPQIDFTKYPNANPATALAAMTHLQANDPKMKVLELIEKARDKESAWTQKLEELAVKHLYDKEIEGIKSGSKVPDSEYKLQIAYENETDPVKKAQMGNILNRIHNEKIRIAKESRTSVNMPKDTTFDKEEQRAIAALQQEDGIVKPTPTQIADKRKKMFRAENSWEKKMEMVADLLLAGANKGSQPEKGKGTSSTTLTYDPKTGTLK